MAQTSYEVDHFLGPADTSRPIPSPAASFRSLRPYLRRKFSRGLLDDSMSGQKALVDPSNSRNVTTKGEGDRTRNVLRRSRSTTWASDTLPRSRPVKRRTDRGSCRDPPPFAEAFRHAILHARLEVVVPRAELKRSGSVLSRLSPALSTTTGTFNSSTEGRSRAGSVALAPKSIILSDDGCLLQYPLEGASNRTPERVLQLGPKSIAVASDILPGRHWVLNVSSNSNSPELAVDRLLRSPRPTFGFRGRSEQHKRAQGLLIAFNDDTMFNDWLVAIRTEIEALGGLEYDPDPIMSTPATVSSGSSPARQFPSAPFVRPLRSSSPSNTGSQDTEDDAVSPLPSTELSDDNIAAFNRWRASCLFDNSLVKAATNSSNEDSDQSQEPEESPAFEPRIQLLVPPKRTRRPDLSPIVIEPTLLKRSSSCSASVRSPQFPRTPTLTSENMHTMAGAFKVPDTPSTPGTSYSPSLVPFAFTQLIEQVTDAISKSPKQNASPPPPPPYSLAPQRQSSQKTQRRSTLRHVLGLGIEDAATPEVGHPSTLRTCSEPQAFTLPHDNAGSIPRPYKPITKDEDGSIWLPPISTRGASSNAFLRMQGPAREMGVEGHGLDRHDDDGPRSCRVIQTCFAVPPGILRAQKSMPSLSTYHDADNASKMGLATTANSPAMRPLPSVPDVPLQERYKIRQPHKLALSDLSTRRTSHPDLIDRTGQSQPGAATTTSISPVSPLMPPLEAPEESILEQRARRSNRPRISPLNSNPLSPAEVKFARRLSVVNGFHVPLSLRT